MRIERRQGSDEKRIVTGMIMDAAVLGRIATHWTGDGPFQAKWCNLVGKWCVDYYAQYNKAPGKDIESLFGSWAADAEDQETVDLVERFLANLSDEYDPKEANPEYIIDVAGRHFNRVNTLRLIDQLQAGLDTGKDAEIAKVLASHTRVELGAGKGVDLFRDLSVVDQVFSESTEPIIRYPDALGTFFGDSLARDCFVSFMGPEKRGKTWWLIDLAFRGLLQRRKVAFFEVGDMTLGQIARRFGYRAARWPRKACTLRIPTSVSRPDDWEPVDGKMESSLPLIEYQEMVYEYGLSAEGCKAAFQSLMDDRVKSKHELFRLSVHSNDSITATGIHSILAGWERSGWVPDVVVIDYADILAPPPGRMESRDAVNSTWKRLRALSQDYHCLVVTATQADAASYNVATLGKSNFSEDKRKFAHTTGMVGINALDSEKLAGVTRLNWLVLREEEFITSKCVYAVGCLGVGNPALKSCY